MPSIPHILATLKGDGQWVINSLLIHFIQTWKTY